MKSEPITLRPDAPFLEIQHLFVEAQIGGAPVVDATGKVRGVISSSDLLRILDQVYDDDIDADEPSDDEARGEDLVTLTALDVATPEVIWVAPDATISEVAQTMRDEGVHRVLVGTNGRIEGLLTAFDLLQAVRS